MRGRGRGSIFGALRVAALLVAAASVSAVTPLKAETGYRYLTIDGVEVAWHFTGAARPPVLTYGFATSVIERGGAPTCPKIEGFDALLSKSRLELEAVREAARRAFDRWSTVIDVTFVPSPDGVPADILLGTQVQPQGVAFTSLDLGAPSSDGRRDITGGVICLNPQKPWKMGFDGDLTRYDLEHVLTHEIGHVLGLDHPGARGHVMAFRYLEDVSGLTAGDIAGAAALYGLRVQPPSVQASPKPADVTAVTAHPR